MSGEAILYNAEDGRAQLRLVVVDGTVWLSQAELAELFQTTKQNVSVHVRNILAEGELTAEATVKEYLTVQTDRATRRQQTTMSEWADFADAYLKLADRAVLTHAGSVGHDQMLKIIDQRYAAFDAARKEADRQAAEVEHEQDIETELKRIEATASQAKRVASSPKPKTAKPTGDET